MYQNHDSSKTVAYFYNYQIGKFHYGKEHPMKPKRIAMAHNLIVNYGLYRHLDVYQSREASFKELKKFHDNDYLQYLSKFISQQKINIIREYQQYSNVLEKPELQSNQLNFYPEDVHSEFDLLPNRKPQDPQPNFRVGDSQDCPSFPGLFTFCQLSTGASIDSAHSIITNEAQIAINWSGGLHHAKKREASGFCYVNDIVICILELLRVFTRVLYVDIDVHHGDGVEEAFFLTNRVMTLSFHQYGDDFYPGSGNIESVGEGPGKYHSINVPLKPGMTDETYFELFKKVLDRVMQSYRPDAVVIQCGADSLSYDKLGGFNLSIRGHGQCVEYMKVYGVPLIVLGGGGYTIANVSRCWAYETGMCLGQKIELPIPSQDIYYDLYSPDYKLHFPIKTNVENKNNESDLDKIVQTISEYLREIESAPGIQFHNVPISFYPDMDNEEEDEADPEQVGEMNLRQYEDNDARGSDPIGGEIIVDPTQQKIHKKEN